MRAVFSYQFPAVFMTEPSDPLPWLEHELKIRYLYEKRRIDAERHAGESSKLILTNLVWINAAGLGSLPVTAAFIGIGGLPWSQKFPLIISPSVGFTVGLFAALLSALLAYVNALYIATTAEHDCQAEIKTLQLIQNTFQLSESIRAKAASDREAGIHNANKSRQCIKLAFIASHILGWLSFLSFVYACYQLARITVP
jgi:hypothetical protein